MSVLGTKGVSVRLRLVPEKGKRVFVSRYSSEKRLRMRGQQAAIMWLITSLSASQAC